jgi:phosphatidylserine/phosphatidylglycerophosphate/cardiolipin synthase-like enzyme
MWFVKEEPLAIVIENPEIAKGFRKQFDFLWELAEKKKRK